MEEDAGAGPGPPAGAARAPSAPPRATTRAPGGVKGWGARPASAWKDALVARCEAAVKAQRRQLVQAIRGRRAGAAGDDTALACGTAPGGGAGGGGGSGDGGDGGAAALLSHLVATEGARLRGEGRARGGVAGPLEGGVVGAASAHRVGTNGSGEAAAGEAADEGDEDEYDDDDDLTADERVALLLHLQDTLLHELGEGGGGGYGYGDDDDDEDEKGEGGGYDDYYEYGGREAGEEVGGGGGGYDDGYDGVGGGGGWHSDGAAAAGRGAMAAAADTPAFSRSASGAGGGGGGAWSSSSSLPPSRASSSSSHPSPWRWDAAGASAATPVRSGGSGGGGDGNRGGSGSRGGGATGRPTGETATGTSPGGLRVYQALSRLERREVEALANDFERRDDGGDGGEWHAQLGSITEEGDEGLDAWMSQGGGDGDAPRLLCPGCRRHAVARAPDGALHCSRRCGFELSAADTGGGVSIAVLQDALAGGYGLHRSACAAEPEVAVGMRASGAGGPPVRGLFLGCQACSGVQLLVPLLPLQARR